MKRRDDSDTPAYKLPSQVLRNNRRQDLEPKRWDPFEPSEDFERSLYLEHCFPLDSTPRPTP